MKDRSRTDRGELGLKAGIGKLEPSESERNHAQVTNLKIITRMADEMSIIAEIGRIIGITLEINEVFERFAE